MYSVITYCLIIAVNYFAVKDPAKAKLQLTYFKTAFLVLYVLTN